MCRPIDADALMGVFAGEFPGMYSKRFIKHLIDGMPTMPEWVSVKDRLPEDPGWYLTYHHKINLCVVSWFTGDGWEDGDWGAYEDGWVSHWMPLPEDPKEEA